MPTPKTTDIPLKCKANKDKNSCCKTFICIICALTAFSSVVAPFRDILLNIAVVGIKGEDIKPIVIRDLQIPFTCQSFVNPNTATYTSKNNSVSYVEDYYLNGSFYSDMLTILQNQSQKSRHNGSQLYTMNICTDVIGKYNGAKLEYLIDGELVAGALLFTGSHSDAFPKRGTNFGISVVAFNIVNLEMNTSSEMWYTKTFHTKDKLSDAMTTSHFIENGDCAGYLRTSTNGCASYGGTAVTESLFYFQTISCAPSNINTRTFWGNIFETECKALVFYKQWLLTCLITATLGCLMVNRAISIFPIFIHNWRTFALLDVDCLDLLLNDLSINIFQILSFIVNYPSAMMIYSALRSGYTVKNIMFLVLRITMFSNFGSSVAVVTGRILKVPVLSRSGTLYAICTMLFMFVVTNDKWFQLIRTSFSHVVHVQLKMKIVTWFDNVPGYSFYLQLWIYASVFVYILVIGAIGMYFSQNDHQYANELPTSYEIARKKRYFENAPCGILRNEVVHIIGDNGRMISGIAILLDGFVSINSPKCDGLNPHKEISYLLSVQAFRNASSNRNSMIKYRSISSDLKLEAKISTSTITNLGYSVEEMIHPQLFSLR